MFWSKKKPSTAPPASPAEPLSAAPAAPATPAGATAPTSIRLVAVDLDGTLLNDSKQVTEQTAGALACLDTRQVRLVLASARPPRGVRQIYRSLRLQTLQINYNGALIWDEPRQTPFFHRPMDHELVRRMIDLARDHYEEVTIGCEILDKWYTDAYDPAAVHTTETGRFFQPDVVAPIAEFCTQPITKLLFLAPPAITNRLEPLLIQGFEGQCTFVRTDDDLIQIMHPMVSKAVALQLVADHYGIPMQQVMAIGDAPNDVGMLRAAGVGVAMDNAAEIVKQAANWVAPSNNDHGVHAALKRYGLCD
jgi:Cof subfamily protein (haloacid dehalogenase superfamily)